jgi:hypothetical protein
MRFSVDDWEPGYGSSMEFEELLPDTAATVVTDLEMPAADWMPIPARTVIRPPSAVLFVDGVRRIDARIWIDDDQPVADTDITGAEQPAVTASMAICASYAAGALCCCGTNGRRQAHLVTAQVQRGLFTTGVWARTISTTAGSYTAHRAKPVSGVPITMTLSNALQRALAEVETRTALAARTDDLADMRRACAGRDADDDLLVVDGPLRNRSHLPRAVGFIKSHRAGYLPAALNPVVAALRPGERTPVFEMGTGWVRRAWYLRLPAVPATPGAPWAGVVRCEAAKEPSEAIALANLSQVVLPRYASVAYKDSRAPQNLVPIGGLEAALRHRLGDNRILHRALRAAARRADG